jgi:hypothetical protein
MGERMRNAVANKIGTFQTDENARRITGNGVALITFFWKPWTRIIIFFGVVKEGLEGGEHERVWENDRGGDDQKGLNLG